jgi:hypothetical protein
MIKSKILFIDDDKNWHKIMDIIFKRDGFQKYELLHAFNKLDYNDIINEKYSLDYMDIRNSILLVIIDIELEKSSNILSQEIIDEINKANPFLPIVALSEGESNINFTKRSKRKRRIRDGIDGSFNENELDDFLKDIENDIEEYLRIAEPIFKCFGTSEKVKPLRNQYLKLLLDNKINNKYIDKSSKDFFEYYLNDNWNNQYEKSAWKDLEEQFENPIRGIIARRIILALYKHFNFDKCKVMLQLMVFSEIRKAFFAKSKLTRKGIEDLIEHIEDNGLIKYDERNGENKIEFKGNKYLLIPSKNLITNKNGLTEFKGNVYLIIDGKRFDEIYFTVDSENDIYEMRFRKNNNFKVWNTQIGLTDNQLIKHNNLLPEEEVWLKSIFDY